MAPPCFPSATRLFPAFALALLGAAGCAEETVEPYVPESPDAFEVGTGERDFRVLGPGATVPLTAGGQGGFHIWVSVRCGTCGPLLSLTYGVEDADTGEPITSGQQEYVTLAEQDGWREVTGLTAFLRDFDPTPYQGRRARFYAVSFTDDGSPLEAEAEATISGVEESN